MAQIDPQMLEDAAYRGYMKAQKERPASLGQLSQAVPQAEKTVKKKAVDLASEWLEKHPHLMKKAGRWLEENVKPEGVTVSYRTWNRAKKRRK